MNPMRCFRPARSRSRAANVILTLLQTAVMWGVFLVAIPWTIISIEAKFAAPGFDPSGVRLIAVLIFCAAGAIGIWCGMSFALLGEGTPLPTDTTTKLVVVGPYRYVRNPMAVLGILQGVMVGVFLGSFLVIAYALAGIVAWHVLARPYEEADLEARFGEPYRRYKQSVPLWIPSLSPYPQIIGTAGDSTVVVDSEGSVTSGP